MAHRKRDSIQISGKTVDEAVQRALRELGLTRSQVDVRVIQEGRPGIFGIGATAATVRVTVRGGTAAEPAPEADAPLLKIDDYADYEEVSPSQRRDAGRRKGGPRQQRGRGRGGRGGRGQPEAPAQQPFELLADPDYEPDEEPIQHAANVLTDLLHLLGVQAEVSTRDPETPMDGLDHAMAVLDVTPAGPDDDLGLLIGHRGENLATLQYVVNVILSHSFDRQPPITVDVDRYKRRREEALNSLAQRMGDQVRETHELAELEPMPAAERRIVHLALADDPDVSTESVGENDARKVQIVYREGV